MSGGVGVPPALGGVGVPPALGWFETASPDARTKFQKLHRAGFSEHERLNHPTTLSGGKREILARICPKQSFFAILPSFYTTVSGNTNRQRKLLSPRKPGKNKGFTLLRLLSLCYKAWARFGSFRLIFLAFRLILAHSGSFRLIPAHCGSFCLVRQANSPLLVTGLGSLVKKFLFLIRYPGRVKLRSPLQGEKSTEH